MLGELKLSYVEYTAGQLAVVLAKTLTVPAWGRAIDRFGPRAPFQVAALLIALIPLPWLFAEGVAVVVVAQVLSGFAWGGHEVSQFSMLLDGADARMRPQLFASVNILSGVAQVAGTLAGAALLAGTGGAYTTVFAASMAGRFAVAAIAPRLIPAHRGGRPVRRMHVLFRIIGFGPSGGVEQRALTVSEDDES
jgi:MFS family permease